MTVEEKDTPLDLLLPVLPLEVEEETEGDAHEDMDESSLWLPPWFSPPPPLLLLLLLEDEKSSRDEPLGTRTSPGGRL